MKEHEAIEVRVEGLEDLGFVESMIVFHKGAYLHLVADPPFNHGPERVLRRALWQREFRVAIRHTFGPDEDNVEFHTREDVGELDPDCAGERRFRPCAEDEDPHWLRTAAQAFDVDAASRFGGVKHIT